MSSNGLKIAIYTQIPQRIAAATCKRNSPQLQKRFISHSAARANAEKTLSAAIEIAVHALFLRGMKNTIAWKNSDKTIAAAKLSKKIASCAVAKVISAEKPFQRKLFCCGAVVKTVYLLTCKRQFALFQI